LSTQLAITVKLVSLSLYCPASTCLPDSKLERHRYAREFHSGFHNFNNFSLGFPEAEDPQIDKRVEVSPFRNTKEEAPFSNSKKEAKG
jgi:hypothetical protein